jgi:hypothetical protein
MGVLTAALGRQGLTQQLTTATGPWARLWSVHSVMPASGLVFITMGVLVALGLFSAALGVMFAGAAAGVAAFGVGALRTARAGNRRAAAILAAVALLLLVFFTVDALEWRTAANVLFAAWAGGLLAFGLSMLARRWNSSTRTQRHSLLQHVTFSLAMCCLVASGFLSTHQRTAALVLIAAGGLCLLLAFALLIIIRRETGRWTSLTTNERCEHHARRNQEDPPPAGEGRASRRGGLDRGRLAGCTDRGGNLRADRAGLLDGWEGDEAAAVRARLRADRADPVHRDVGRMLVGVQAAGLFLGWMPALFLAAIWPLAFVVVVFGFFVALIIWPEQMAQIITGFMAAARRLTG